jgi:hypothetical protein
MIKLKSILKESYAWQRQEGKPLPTMKDVQEKYQRNLKEQEAPSSDGTNYQVIKTPAGKFKIGVVSPEDGKLYDASQFFGGGTFWQKEYMSEPEAHAAIRSLNQPKNDDMMEEAYDAKGNEESYIDVYHMYKNGEMTKNVFNMFISILQPHEQ